MTISKWEYEMDSEIGHEPESIVMGNNIDGCGLDGCSCSDSLWIKISFGTINGITSGITVYFWDKAEKERFLNNELIEEMEIPNFK